MMGGWAGNTYDVFEGKDLKIAEKIQQRRLQLIVHSCLYYELNQSVVPDVVWDTWARELVRLQKEYPAIAKEVMYAKEFEGFDGSTGFDLPIRDEWVMLKAKKLLRIRNYAGKKEEKPKKTKQVKTKLF